MVAGVWVREMGMDEVGEVVGLSAALFREDAGRRDPSVNLGWPAEEGWDHFTGFVAAESSLCLVAGFAGKIAGYLAGYVKEESALRPVRVAELESMYVREEYRGLGIGARLVGEFLYWAETRGAVLVSVSAYAENERALRFYRREGFQEKSVSLEMGLGDYSTTDG